ncbi:hypothetical protein [Priestia endophytica]|uniref:hypothetical protein n=1 Tax=Priestia endophytica TaxID=135735 RepID=UPI00124C276F|nr:hypothetical protein [Priestia endophytica]KAB2489985.1 hypothetical protein F8155_21580 [Priestia endophytica]
MIMAYTREEFEGKIKKLREKANLMAIKYPNEPEAVYSVWDEIDALLYNFVDDGLYFIPRHFKEMLDQA